MADGEFSLKNISEEGVIISHFTATIDSIEERKLRGSSQDVPFLLVTLSQKENDIKILSIAINKSYHQVKDRYKLGAEYTFPSGTFRSRVRDLQYQSTSNCGYDLFFIEVPTAPKNTSRFVRQPPSGEAGGSKSSAFSFRPPV